MSEQPSAVQAAVENASDSAAGETSPQIGSSHELMQKAGVEKLSPAPTVSTGTTSLRRTVKRSAPR